MLFHFGEASKCLWKGIRYDIGNRILRNCLYMQTAWQLPIQIFKFGVTIRWNRKMDRTFVNGYIFKLRKIDLFSLNWRGCLKYNCTNTWNICTNVFNPSSPEPYIQTYLEGGLLQPPSCLGVLFHWHQNKYQPLMYNLTLWQFEYAFERWKIVILCVN